jgi:phosphotransferase system enzyme I (PtsI)
MKRADKSKTVVLQGKTLNPGRVVAQVCLYASELHRSVAEYTLENKKEVEKALARFEQTVEKSRIDLENAAKDVESKIGKAEAQIFTAQKLILLDPVLLDKIKTKIKQKTNAEYAVFSVFREYEQRFESLENEYMRDRAKDIAGIRRRLLDYLKATEPGFLCEGQPDCKRGLGRIIVTKELTPRMISNVDFTRVEGFVTEHGGVSSHAAIIARAIGVPAVSNVHGIMDNVACSDKLLLDGNEGKVYLWPDKSTVDRLIPKVKADKAEKVLLETPANMEVLANVSMTEDIEVAEKVNADGIGLFRTEFLFIRSGRLLNEEEQVNYYTEVLKKMGEKPVTFRLIDTGGDKPLGFLNREQETNPALGLRGARFLLSEPDVFRTQVRAFARTSNKGRLKVLYPMVIDLNQLSLLQKETQKVLSEVEYKEDNLSFGVMFEVPGACLQAEEILKHTDFASVGTNDLIQYLFAVDRDNEHVVPDYKPDHPVLWSLLKGLSSKAKAANIPLSVCGEMAGLPGMAAKFLEIGITSLSVSPRLIPNVRVEMAETVNPG